MNKDILMLTSLVELPHAMRGALENEGYRVTVVSSLESIQTGVAKARARALIMDLDAVPVDDSFFRSLKKKSPDLSIVGISSRPFHPELREAMSRHIYATLNKPVDPDELLYWLSCIFDQMEESEKKAPFP